MCSTLVLNLLVFCSKPGVVTVNLYTMRNEALDIFKPNRWVLYAILTGVFYAVADIYFLRLSGQFTSDRAADLRRRGLIFCRSLLAGSTKLHHLADVSVLAPLCALYILIPTALGVVIDVRNGPHNMHAPHIFCYRMLLRCKWLGQTCFCAECSRNPSLS
eukprot:SAG31_NODE_774_length_12192_cov_26.736128_8_plen_160_part_00